MPIKNSIEPINNKSSLTFIVEQYSKNSDERISLTFTGYI